MKNITTTTLAVLFTSFALASTAAAHSRDDLSLSVDVTAPVDVDVAAELALDETTPDVLEVLNTFNSPVLRTASLGAEVDDALARLHRTDIEEPQFESRTRRDDVLVFIENDAPIFAMLAVD